VRPCPACPPAPPGPAVLPATQYEPAAFASIPGWGGAELLPGLRAFLAGCPSIAAASVLGRACAAARAAAPQDEAAARRFVESAFSAWVPRPADGNADGLITGYYEPVLAGSRTRTDRFRQPVYGVPEDLLAVDLAGLHPELRGLRLRGRLEGARVIPYWSRGEIESRGVRAATLAWVEDPVELFFLQIQGSGQVELERGGRLRLGYAEQNGHPYRSLGRYLIDKGELTLEQASMQGIKAWAAANPQKLREALDSNPSYVFFRELAADGGGPPGALGAPLTAGYSVAIDPRAVPLGAPVFLATTWPLSTQPLERLMAAQDTGGAIRGAQRADFFWGTGAEAGAQAGRMRQRGVLWILWPRGEAAPRP
jgi:membrane-bound lytic murein transglycosylase A